MIVQARVIRYIYLPLVQVSRPLQPREQKVTACSWGVTFPLNILNERGKLELRKTLISI